MKVIRYIHEWTNVKNTIVFHTFPMIHIGEKKYYNEISLMLNEMNHILIEGVSLKRGSELGSYRRFAHTLGLYAQSDSLYIPEDLTVKNIDMPSKQFRKELFKLPIIDKIKVFIINIVLKNVPKKYSKSLLNKMRIHFSYNDDNRVKLINPDNHYAAKQIPKSKLEMLFENKRDSIITKNIENYINENIGRLYRMDVAILFGDSHMPYIYKELKRKGFKWKLEKTIEVF
jgi:hypothetical protein